MRRFFTEPENVNLDDKTLLIYEDASHIAKVLRFECGDKILVFDGSGYEYESELVEITNKFSKCRILGQTESRLEPKIDVTLFQGIPKSGKLDVIVQKAVELGVHSIVPVGMKRCVAKIPSDKKGVQKIERLNKISKEAAKQCGRGLVPKVTLPMDFVQMLSEIKNFDLCIMLYEELGHSGSKNFKQVLRENSDVKSIAVLIGPEGGFSVEEAEKIKSASKLEENNIFCVGLGERILRTETAGSTALSIIMYEKDEI